MSNGASSQRLVEDRGTSSSATAIKPVAKNYSNKQGRQNAVSAHVDGEFHALIERLQTEIDLESALIGQGRELQAENIRAQYTKRHGRPFVVEADMLGDRIEQAAVRWVDRSTHSNLETLASFQAEILTPEMLSKLQRNARQYLDQTEDQLEIEEFLPLKPDFAAPREIPGAKYHNRRIQLEALGQIQDPHLNLLYMHPHGSHVIRQIATNRADGALAIEAIVVRAYDANLEFFRDIVQRYPDQSRKRRRNDVWLYPPIIMGALHDLGLSGNKTLVRFALQSIAPTRAGDAWNQFFLVAGIALAAAALVTAGPIGAMIALVDFGLAGLETYRGYVSEMQNVMATQAGNMPLTLKFTERQSDFGNVALAGAATLISGISILRGGLKIFGKGARGPGQIVNDPVSPPRAFNPADALDPTRRSVPGTANKATDSQSKLIRPDSTDPGATTPEWLESHRHDSAKIENNRMLSGRRKFAPFEMEPDTKNADELFLPKPNQVKRGLAPSKRTVKEKTRRTRELKRIRELKKAGIEPTAETPLPRPRQHTFTRAEQLTGIPLDEAYRRSLRGKTPTKELQKWAQSQLKEGDPDPALVGLRVDGPAQADHIVAMERIRLFDGFAELTEVNQLKVLNMKSNFSALSPQANRSKGAKSYAKWFRHDELGVPVDEAFRNRMLTREQELIPMIQSKINELLEQQMRGL